MRLQSFVFLLIALAPNVYADADKKELTVNEAVAEALKRNPNLQRQRAEVEAARARVARARSLSGLQTGLSLQYRRQGPTVSVPSAVPFSSPIEIVPDSSYTGTITAQKLLYDGGRASGERRVAELGVDVAREQLRDAERVLARDVKRAYYNLLKAESLRRVAEDTGNLANEQLRIARVRFAEGASPRFDVTRSEVEASNAKQELITAEKNVALTRASLNLLLSRPLNGSVTASPPPEPATTVEADDEIALARLTQTAFDTRPELRIAKRQSLLATERRRVAAAENAPQINLNSAYSKQTAAAFQSNYNWFAGIGINFDFFNSGRTRAGVREAKFSEQGAEASATQVRQTVEFEVKQAHLSLREARQRIETTAATVRSARENIGIARLRYDNGVGLNLEVMDAQLALSRSLAQNVTAIYDYWTALAELEAVVGRSNQ